MTYEEKILKLIENNNGIITTKQVNNEKIPKIYLTKLVKKNEIQRIKRGIYGDINKFEDEFYIFQLRYPNAIFSYNTALYIHGLTERTPDKLDVTVYRGYTGRKLDFNIVTHYVKKEILNLGIMTVDSPYGNKIKVYDKERCICDIVKNRTKIDIELFNKIIRNYFEDNNRDINRLFEYAKKMNVFDKLVPYVGTSI